MIKSCPTDVTNSQKLSDSQKQSRSCSNTNMHMHDVHTLNEEDITSRLHALEQKCVSQGVRLTPLRRHVYELILRSDRPVGAYDLIEDLQEARSRLDGDDAKMVAPPTIYRTLEFLLNLGFVHQLTSVNAFVPCCHPRDEHNAIFLLCNRCQRVQECSQLPVRGVMDYVKDSIGFKVEQSIMELRGLCGHCV